MRPFPLTADAGLGQSVYTANRTAGSGYAQQWNLAVQREITNNLSVEFAYTGSHIVHVGIPDSNLNQLTAAQLAQGSSLLTPVTNPYYGQLPVSSSIGGKTVSTAQLLKPYPRFLNVATYRHNSGETNYNAGQVKVERRFSSGLALLFGYTHSRLIDDASSVFSTTVLSSPNSSSLIAADTFRPQLERDVSSGNMSNVTTFSGVYDLPMGRGHRFASSGLADAVIGGWTLNSILSVQSGMPVTVTQATNNNSFAGFALQRPNLIRAPNLSPGLRFPAHYFNTAALPPRPNLPSAPRRATPSTARLIATSTWPWPSTPSSRRNRHRVPRRNLRHPQYASEFASPTAPSAQPLSAASPAPSPTPSGPVRHPHQPVTIGVKSPRGRRGAPCPILTAPICG